MDTPVTPPRPRTTPHLDPHPTGLPTTHACRGNPALRLLLSHWVARKQVGLMLQFDMGNLLGQGSYYDLTGLYTSRIHTSPSGGAASSRIFPNIHAMRNGRLRTTLEPWLVLRGHGAMRNSSVATRINDHSPSSKRSSRLPSISTPTYSFSYEHDCQEPQSRL